MAGQRRSRLRRGRLRPAGYVPPKPSGERTKPLFAVVIVGLVLGALCCLPVCEAGIAPASPAIRAGRAPSRLPSGTNRSGQARPMGRPARRFAAAVQPELDGASCRRYLVRGCADPDEMRRTIPSASTSATGPLRRWRLHGRQPGSVEVTIFDSPAGRCQTIEIGSAASRGRIRGPGHGLLHGSTGFTFESTARLYSMTRWAASRYYAGEWSSPAPVWYASSLNPTTSVLPMRTVGGADCRSARGGERATPDRRGGPSSGRRLRSTCRGRR